MPTLRAPLSRSARRRANVGPHGQALARDRSLPSRRLRGAGGRARRPGHRQRRLPGGDIARQSGQRRGRRRCKAARPRLHRHRGPRPGEAGAGAAHRRVRRRAGRRRRRAVLLCRPRRPGRRAQLHPAGRCQARRRGQAAAGIRSDRPGARHHGAADEDEPGLPRRLPQQPLRPRGRQRAATARPARCRGWRRSTRRAARSSPSPPRRAPSPSTVRGATRPSPRHSSPTSTGPGRASTT
jgi:hypothetical protein